MTDFRERAERALQSVQPQCISSSKAAMVIAEVLATELAAVHDEARREALREGLVYMLEHLKGRAESGLPSEGGIHLARAFAVWVGDTEASIAALHALAAPESREEKPCTPQ